jgi:hypothetical protein
MSSIDDKILFVKVVVGKSPDNAVSWLKTVSGEEERLVKRLK